MDAAVTATRRTSTVLDWRFMNCYLTGFWGALRARASRCFSAHGRMCRQRHGAKGSAEVRADAGQKREAMRIRHVDFNQILTIAVWKRRGNGRSHAAVP